MSFDVLLSILWLSHPPGWDNSLLIRVNSSFVIAADLALNSGLY